MKVLFGVRSTSEDWAEELITEQEELISQAKDWAIKAGFRNLRVADIDLDTPPDFTKCIN